MRRFLLSMGATIFTTLFQFEINLYGLLKVQKFEQKSKNIKSVDCKNVIAAI